MYQQLNNPKQTHKDFVANSIFKLKLTSDFFQRNSVIFLQQTCTTNYEFVASNIIF